MSHKVLLHYTEGSVEVFNYCKVPKFSEAGKLHVNLPKIQTKRSNPKAFCQEHANGIANSEDPDQTAPSEDPDQTAPIGAV